MGDITGLVDFISQNKSNALTTLILVLLVTAVFVAGVSYKDKFLYYILHKRNRWYVAAFLVSTAVLFFIIQKSIFSFGGLTFLACVDVLYGIICFLRIRKPIFKKVRAKASEESILGNKKKAYEILCEADSEMLYEDELEDFTVAKAMLLWEMGDFSAAYGLLGVPEECKYQNNPMVWVTYSLVDENAGDLDKAYEYLLKAKSLLEQEDIDSIVKAQVYNNFGRIQLMRGNRLEGIKYYNDAYRELKNAKQTRTDLLHIILSNLILNKTLNNPQDAAIPGLLTEYKDQIDMTVLQNMIEYTNCLLSYYRQTKDVEKEFDCIQNGYRAMVQMLDGREKALLQASTFQIIMNGHFVYQWFDEEIRNSIDSYFQLPVVDKLEVCNAYMGILQQEDYRYVRNQEPYKTLIARIMEYYAVDAINDIDKLLEVLKPYEIYQYQRLMVNKLSILKLTEKEKHIENSKQMYLDLSKMLYDAGMHIMAVNIWMRLIDEAASGYNLEIQGQPGQPPMSLQEVMDKYAKPSAPKLLENGITLTYFRLEIPPICKMTPLYKDLIAEKIEFVIKEYDKWQNHPTKLELSMKIAHYMMCLGQGDRAERFFRFFEESRISERQYSAWHNEEYHILGNVFRSYENSNK